MPVKMKYLQGVAGQSYLKLLTDKMDALTKEYYPIKVKGGSVFPDFSSAKVTSLQSSKIYRANMPGYFYRMANSKAEADSSNSVIRFSSDPVHIDHEYLGAETNSISYKTIDEETKKDVVVSFIGSVTIGSNYSKRPFVRTPYGIYHYGYLDFDLKINNGLWRSGGGKCDTFCGFVQLKVADEGISSECMNYVCNRGADSLGGLGCQLVPLLPGVENTAKTLQHDKTTGKTTKIVDEIYATTVPVRVEVGVYSTDGKSLGGTALTTTVGFYFQYYSDYDKGLYFVPSQIVSTWDADDGIPTSSATEIKNSELKNNTGRYQIGDLCPSGYSRDDGIACMFSEDSKSVVVYRSKNEVKPDSNFNWSVYRTGNAKNACSILETPTAKGVHYNVNEYRKNSPFDNVFGMCFSGRNPKKGKFYNFKFLMMELNSSNIPDLHSTPSSLCGVAISTSKTENTLDMAQITFNDYTGNMKVYTP